MNRQKQKMMAMLLIVAMLFTFVPTAAFAEGEATVTVGDFTVTLAEGVDAAAAYNFENGVLTITTDSAIRISNTGITSHRILVADGVSANITLAGVNIDVSGTDYAAAFQIADNSKGSVTITLADNSTNTLKSGKYAAGLQKNSDYYTIKNDGTDGKLTIGGTGSLIANGGAHAAGIGGGGFERPGSVTHETSVTNICIDGGQITATGGVGGAGIGSGENLTGGGQYDRPCIAANIKITGGRVIASGGEQVDSDGDILGGGAGIGGGMRAPASNITIEDGTVTATGAEKGAGIGGGFYGGATGIEITGGTVTATGKNMAAGIGSGGLANISSESIKTASNIIISGENTKVTATGGKYGAGIGSGQNCPANNITISGGKVTATGGLMAAGIGSGTGLSSGSENLVSNIKITGGTVTATGGDGNEYASDDTQKYGGAGIGSGWGEVDADGIIITGGIINATGGKGAAGIGGGYGGNGTNISISSGFIKAATVMQNDRVIGAGSGTVDANSVITITGGQFENGNVTAKTVYGVTVALCATVAEQANNTDYPYLVSQGDHTDTTAAANNDGTHDVIYACCGTVKADDEKCELSTATCQAKAKCSVCEAEYGEKDTTKHTSDEVTYSYTAEGRHEKTYTCCQITETEDCSGGTASCTAKAVCSKCNTAYGSELAHSYTVPQSDATHHWNKCANCDAIDAKVAHTEEPIAAKAPTCTETGLTAGKQCSVCNEVLTAQTVIAALGHNYNDNNICTVCGDKKATTTTGGGGFSGTYNYPVSTPTTDNGSVSLSDSNASAGETVTATVTPDKGYGVAEVIVTDEKGNIIPVTYLGDGEYSFVMPAGKVNIETVCKPAITLTIGSQIANVFGKNVKNDVAPIITAEGRTMLPIRFVAEALGANVSWNADTQTVTITKDGVTVQIIIGADYAYINGKKVKLDAPAFIANGRTYLPVRFISEALGSDVNWDTVTRQVVIMK